MNTGHQQRTWTSSHFLTGRRKLGAPSNRFVVRRACAWGVGIAFVAFASLASLALADEEIVIAIHHAYGTQERFRLEGRIAERHDVGEPRFSDSWLVNFWRSLRALRVEELKGTPLLLKFASRTWQLHSDKEGYFTLAGETPPQARTGWNPVLIEVAGGAVSTDASLLILPPGETLGIISDVDDTVVVSEVEDLSRLLRHSLLENHLQRLPVPGVAEFYHAILARNALPETAPVMYLTAAPRQLVPTIRSFLEHNRFPTGVIVAKKITDGAGGDPLLDQERYKLARIERILADLPAARFVLVGDDGERDPEVFRAIRERYPSRIEAVYIRRVNPDPSRPAYVDQQSLAAELQVPDSQQLP